MFLPLKESNPVCPRSSFVLWLTMKQQAFKKKEETFEKNQNLIDFLLQEAPAALFFVSCLLCSFWVFVYMCVCAVFALCKDQARALLLDFKSFL